MISMSSGRPGASALVSTAVDAEVCSLSFVVIVCLAPGYPANGPEVGARVAGLNADGLRGGAARPADRHALVQPRGQTWQSIT
jgi:hypothetical protein